MAALSAVNQPFNVNSYNPQTAAGNGNYTMNGFRFDDATAASNPQLAQFNQQANAGNFNGAYGGLMSTGGGSGSYALKNAFAGAPDQSTIHQIINTFSPGGTNAYFGAGTSAPGLSHGPSASGYFDSNGNWMPPGSALQGTKAYAQQYGTGTATAYGPGATPGTLGASAPAGSGAPPTTATTGSLAPAPLPGTGNTSYAAPITDPSAYLDPSMAFQMQQGSNAIQNSAAARGGLNSGQTLKDLTSFSQGLAGTNWQNAFNNAQTDTNRRYGVDSADRNFDYNAANNDRQFGYNAAVDDRNFNANQNQQQAQMGLQGTQGNASMQSTLAALLSGNSIAAGQAQGTGTVGANNSLTNALSQILSQMYGNNALSQIQGI